MSSTTYESVRERKSTTRNKQLSTIEESQENSRLNQQAPKRRSCLNYCILATLFVLPLIFVFFYPYLRIKPLKAHYIKLSDAVKFEGNLARNTLLQYAVYFGKGKFRGAESIIFVNDTMFSGVLNGKIVRFDSDGNPHTITQTVDGTDDAVCNDFGPNFESKKECGRPLGLRFKAPNWIYFADAYYGIFKVNIDTNEKQLVLKHNDEKFKEKPLMFANDLDLDDNGNIYFTDSSASRTVHEAIELHVEAVPDGRLFRYNENTNELALLIDNLNFPNGIQFTPQKDALIVAETNTARLVKYYINGPKQGHREVFINLPGFPDNIHTSEHNTIFVGFAIARKADPNKPTILDLFGEYPLIRTLVGSVLNVRALLLKLPKYALVAEYDFSNGNLIHSWHDPDGKIIQNVAGVTMHNNKLYLSSFYADYIAVLDYKF